MKKESQHKQRLCTDARSWKSRKFRVEKAMDCEMGQVSGELNTVFDREKTVDNLVQHAENIGPNI